MLLRLGLLLSLSHSALSYDSATCCQLAKSEHAFIWNDISAEPNSSLQVCGQNYRADLAPAMPLLVNYTFCSSRCRGMDLSKVDLPSEWAAPLVTFILPSVIFSMTIPRRKKIDVNYMFEFKWPQKLPFGSVVKNAVQLLMSFICFLFVLIPVTIDSLVWITVIVVGAGNMLVSGLYEAHLDYRIVKYVQGKNKNNDEVTLKAKRELLVTIACGNLSLPEKKDMDRSVLKSIAKSLTVAETESDGHKNSASRLLNLLDAQSSFGGAVGSPVLFYLGAFVYSILDLLTNPSSQDAAISLGFGIEWMIIVHVAIVSGCLLAANNPSTSAGIVGSGHDALDLKVKEHPTFRALDRPPSKLNPAPMRKKKKTFKQSFLGWSNAYETEFQPVDLWARGNNKLRWIKESAAWKNDPSFQESMEITWYGWFFKIFIPAFALIVIPPAAGGLVAYFTPPRGVGCRSLSFIMYASSQITTTVFAVIRCAVEDKEKHPLKKWFTGRRYIALSGIFWFVSLVAGIGGTTMQILGVYKNCICYAGANNWHNINKINPLINIATDTLVARKSSRYWIWMGSTATIFMAVNCYIGWWYQRLVRHRFTDAVVKMYIGTNGPQNPAIEPLLHETASVWGRQTEQRIDRVSGNTTPKERNVSRDSDGSMASSQVPLNMTSTGVDRKEGFKMGTLGSRPSWSRNNS